MAEQKEPTNFLERNRRTPRWFAAVAILLGMVAFAALAVIVWNNR